MAGYITTDEVALLADCQNMGYSTSDASLFHFWDFMHSYPYPCVTGGESNIVAGREGDSYILQVPMNLKTTKVNGISPIITKVCISIVAVKSGESDFIVEQKTINVTNANLLGGVQNINYTGTRGYITWNNDPFNTITFKNNKQFNTAGGWTGYCLNYPIVLRYDYWNPIVSSIQGATSNPPIANDGVTLVNSWSGLVKYGWILVARCTVSVSGYDGNITSYQIQNPVICLPMSAPANSALQYSVNTIYYDDDGNVIPGIQIGAVTRIRNIYTPNGFFSQLGEAYFATIWADLLNQGGPTNRRLASSEYPSEAGSPFSDPGSIVYKTVTVPNQYTNGGLRLSWFTSGVYGGIVITETLYDDTVLNWAKGGNLIIIPHIGFQPAPEDLETDQGIQLTTTDNIPIQT